MLESQGKCGPFFTQNCLVFLIFSVDWKIADSSSSDIIMYIDLIHLQKCRIGHML